MDNLDIDKDVEISDDEPEPSWSVDASTIFKPPSPRKVTLSLSGPTGKERQLDKDEKEQSLHPERSGVATWTIPTSLPEMTHLNDPIVYEQEDEGGSGGVSEHRLSFNEVTQQMDQTLYEKSSCSSDVIRVWNAISSYVKSQLRQGTGVTLPGLCTFTVNLRKCSAAGNIRFMLQRKPILVLSPTLVSRYKLVDTSEKIFGFRAPASLINLTEVGVRAKVTRSIVEGVITEVLQTFARALACGKPIEFPFPSIGKLQVRSGVSVMKFYAEFYRSAGYDLDDVTGVDLEEPTGRNFEATRNEIIPGTMTPLNRNIPTESFRSVFHLRDVRSVSELVTVTEEDLRHVNCLQLDCLPPEDIDNEGSDDDGSVIPGPCEPPIEQPEFVWCPAPDFVKEGEGTDMPRHLQSFRGEDGGENYIHNWVQTALVNRFCPEEREGEDGTPRRLVPTTPPSSLFSSEQETNLEEISSRGMTPPRLTRRPSRDVIDIEPSPPCRHNFRPEPLYNPRPSGIHAIDRILPEPTHFSNALLNHHYFLCSKTLGVGVVKKHFQLKVNQAEAVEPGSPFHQF